MFDVPCTWAYLFLDFLWALAGDFYSEVSIVGKKMNSLFVSNRFQMLYFLL